MRQLDGKIAVVTGGSRGLGQGIVRALAAEGAAVWTLARDAERLDQLKREVAGVQTLVADVTDPQTAPQTLRATRPDILVLNAGATPTMAPIHQQSWEQFARVWETDVYMTFAFGKQALLQPLAPGSVVLIVSSGAAIGGSPGSGAYAAQQGISEQAFLEHFGPPLTPESVGQGVVALLTDQAYRNGIAFGISSHGLASLDEGSAAT